MFAFKKLKTINSVHLEKLKEELLDSPEVNWMKGVTLERLNNPKSILNKELQKVIKFIRNSKELKNILENTLTDDEIKEKLDSSEIDEKNIPKFLELIWKDEEKLELVLKLNDDWVNDEEILKFLELIWEDEEMLQLAWKLIDSRVENKNIPKFLELIWEDKEKLELVLNLDDNWVNDEEILKFLELIWEDEKNLELVLKLYDDRVIDASILEILKLIWEDKKILQLTWKLIDSSVNNENIPKFLELIWKDEEKLELVLTLDYDEVNDEDIFEILYKEKTKIFLTWGKFKVEGLKNLILSSSEIQNSLLELLELIWWDEEQIKLWLENIKDAEILEKLTESYISEEYVGDFKDEINGNIDKLKIVLMLDEDAAEEKGIFEVLNWTWDDKEKINAVLISWKDSDDIIKIIKEDSLSIDKLKKLTSK